MFKKISYSFFFIFIFFINISGTTTMLGIKPVKQKHDFCGEASVAIMLDKLDVHKSQNYIHNKIFGLKNTKRGAFSLEIIQGLEKNGYILTKDYNYKLKKRVVFDKKSQLFFNKKFKKLIDKGYPIFFNWYPIDGIDKSFKGHFSLIIGYNKDSFYIFDPRWKNRILKLNKKKFYKYFLAPAYNFRRWGYFYFIIRGKVK